MELGPGEGRLNGVAESLILQDGRGKVDVRDRALIWELDNMQLAVLWLLLPGARPESRMVGHQWAKTEGVRRVKRESLDPG